MPFIQHDPGRFVKFTYISLSDFVDMLNEMRFGTLSQKSIQKFKALSRDIIYEDGLGPTELCVDLISTYSHCSPY